MNRRSLAPLVLLLAIAACRSGTSGPATPSAPADSGLTGTWRGTASDSSGPGQMTWQLTQAGGTINGTVTMTDTATGLTGRGSISGTLSGETLRFTLNIPAGGLDAPFGSCRSEVSGDAQVSGTTMTGSYSGSSSCAGAIASGQLTLNKQ